MKYKKVYRLYRTCKFNDGYMCYFLNSSWIIKKSLWKLIFNTFYHNRWYHGIYEPDNLMFEEFTEEEISSHGIITFNSKIVAYLVNFFACFQLMKQKRKYILEKGQIDYSPVWHKVLELYIVNEDSCV